MNAHSVTLLPYPSSSQTSDDVHAHSKTGDSGTADEWADCSVLDPTTKRWTSMLSIKGMHCLGCAIVVESAVVSLPEVDSALVNAGSGLARVTWKGNVHIVELMRAVGNAGYSAMPAQARYMDDSCRKASRTMLWRVLVAGFCMMQVMMYAFPAYIAAPGEMTADMQSLLRWASWILALPVLFFSCGPFFSSAWVGLKQGQISMDLPVALGISVTFMVSSAATFEPSGWWGQEVYFDSLTMFVFFLLSGRWIELHMRERTAGALDVLMQRLPNAVLRGNADGSFIKVAAHRLQVGDVLQILPGEAFPADGMLVVGSTSADEALLTGESRSVAKDIGDAVVAGSFNLTAPVQMRVEKVGLSTQYAQIINLMQRAAMDKPRLALLADRIAKPFLLAVLLAAVASGAVLWASDHGHALMAAVAVLIVTCPCALSLATPAAMLTISGTLARSGVLVRRMQALEALSQVDTVVFDKTGTLTLDRMTVKRVLVAATAKPLPMTEALALHVAASMAKNSLHPVSRALVAAAQGQPAAIDVGIQQLHEVAGFGLVADSIYGTLKLGSDRFCAVDVTSIADTSPGLSMVHLVSDHGRIASFEIVEALKPDAAVAVAELAALGLSMQIMSGDVAKAVNAIARQLSLSSVEAGLTPQDKLHCLQAMQKRGNKVLMVGDGLNDGPVLASAHVSIAMGQAMPLAQAQSDFVILGGQLALVPQLIVQAKRTMRIVRQNLAWAAMYNATCVPLAVVGMLPAWLAGLGMAFSSFLVILNAARLSRRLPVLHEAR